MTFLVKKLRPDAVVPQRQSRAAAGLDLVAAIDEQVVIEPGEIAVVGTGLAFEIEEQYEIQVRPRSGLAAKHGVTVLNTPGTIDSDYRGEVKVILINHGKQAFVIEPGDRIAQMVVALYATPTFKETDVLGSTERGEGGFGSTGLKVVA